MTRRDLRVVGVLVGELAGSAGLRTKYGLFFDELAQRFRLVDVYNADLSGFPRLMGALRSFHPQRRLWRERFRKSPDAFRARSSEISRRLRRLSGSADLILQVGGLLDARWDDLPMPSVIYTDHTASLTAQTAMAYHSARPAQQREQWLQLERQAYHRAAHICTRGRRVREALIQDYGLPPSRVTAIGGGVNLAALPERVTRPAGTPPTALFIGMEFYRKGGDILLQAFAQARAQVPEARLVCLTADSIPAHLPLAGVEVVRPTWDRTVISALYRQADVFVLPSRLETWGDVLLEAMAFELPCIGVTGQMMEDIILEEETGLLVSPHNAAALAAAVVRVFTDTTLARRWGQAGRRRLESEFTWERVVDRLEAAVCSIARPALLPMEPLR
jgi:glycosyltransferase involved in cell wall biosynthesis